VSRSASPLDRPTQGSVRLGDQHLNDLNERALARLRRERIGFIFQSFNLLDALTAQQNVALPARLAGKRLRRLVVRDVLQRVGLDERSGHGPSQMSGGQQQRVAIARALVGEPSVMFADEPTGALDTRAGRVVLALLRETIDETGGTLVMVTHDPSAAAWADRVVFMADGRLAANCMPRPPSRSPSGSPDWGPDMLRVSLQTLRARRDTLTGAFVAIWLAVTLASATGLLMAAALGPPGAGRLAATDAVVRADPTVTIGHGEYAEGIDLIPGPRLPAATVDRVADGPGVARVVGDIAFPRALGISRDGP
jgi:putative ABC transport system ATP-binding protein